jgi:hypothetical protein
MVAATAPGLKQRASRFDMTSGQWTVLGRAFDALLLLLPGAIAALGLFAMSASLIPGLDRRTAASFLVFLPWQALGLTVAKFGVDSWILARGSQWTGATLPLRNVVVTRTLPAAVATAVLMGTRFPLVPALAGGVSVLFDAIALIVASELSSHGRVRQAALSHFLRYPLFLATLPLVAVAAVAEEPLIYLSFAASSIIRLLVLMALRSPRRLEAGEAPRSGSLALQQVLNYGLFKNDQLAFSLLPAEQHALRQVLVYVARFPELVSAVIVSIGPLVYPAMRGMVSQEPGRRPTALLRSLIGGGFACATAGVAYRALAPSGLAVPWHAVAAVVIHATLVLPVNVHTYECFAAGREGELIRALLAANGIGLVLVLSILLSGSVHSSALLWAIPLQQTAFMYALNRGSRAPRLDVK